MDSTIQYLFWTFKGAASLATFLLRSNSLLLLRPKRPLRCDLHEVVVTSNDDWSVFDNVKDLRGIYERGREVER